MLTLRSPHLGPLLLASLVACGGQTLDVGSKKTGSSGSGETDSAMTNLGATTAGGMNNPPQGPSTGGVEAYGNVNDAGASNSPACVEDPPAGEPLPTWPQPEDCVDGDSPLQGTWTGYVQGPGGDAFPDLGNFTVTLRGDDDALCGSITFGPPRELAPATDPTAAYPPGYDLSNHLPLIEGFKYVLDQPTVTGKRVQFNVPAAQPMRSWCQLQTPYFALELRGGWSCTRNLGTPYDYEPKRCYPIDPCTGADLVMSCVQHEICALSDQPCACNASGCDANRATTNQYFDVRFEGDEASGQLNDQPVFLTRQQP